MEQDQVKQDKNRETERTPEYRHSATYRRHFEDYQTFEYIDAGGTKRSKSVYTGRIYTPPFSKEQYVVRKVLYALCWLLSSALAYFAGSRMVAANMIRLTAALQIGQIVCLCWVLTAVGSYCIAPYRRTIGDQKSARNSLISGTLVSAIAIGAGAAEHLVFLLVGREALGLQLACIACYLLAAAALLLLRAVEKRVEYKITFAQPEFTPVEEDTPLE